MRDVAAFAGLTETVALHGLGKNHRGRSFVFDGGAVGGVNFCRVMAAAQKLMNLIVGKIIYQLEELWVFTEEVFSRVAAWLNRIFLVIAVDGFFHALQQETAVVGFQQRIP